ncbi:MAG: hypothetical protein HYV04_17425 [Deltaproteobacteria bacterium]|nr:hypothetical protein [Deltaproteobacteria bacterium]
MSVVYLKAYLEATRDATFLPTSRDEINTLLDLYLLEKAVYELGYELNNRPDWVEVPIQGIMEILGQAR